MRLSGMSEVTSLSKNGLMVIKNFTTSPKTEVTIRTKGKNVHEYYSRSKQSVCYKKRVCRIK